MLTIATKSKLAFLLVSALMMSAVAGGTAKPAMTAAAEQGANAVVAQSADQDQALSF